MPKVYFTSEGLDARGKVAFDLDRSEVTIGSAVDNDIHISDDPSVAPYHCVMKRVVGGYVIEDLGANGLWHDQQHVPRFMLENGMEFSIGALPVLFAYSKEEILQFVSEMGEAPVTAPTKAPPPPPPQAVEVAQAPISLVEPVAAAPIAESVQPVLNTNRSVAVSKKYDGAKSLNPFVGFLICILVIALGLFGGLYLKHNQETGSNLVKDLKSGEVVPFWE